LDNGLKMAIWDNIKPQLEALSIAIDSLSEVLLYDDEEIIPHLIQNLNLDIIKQVLKGADLDIQVFGEAYEDAIVISNSTTYLIIEHNNEYLAFSVNPFSSLSNFEVRSALMDKELKTSLGFIEPKHPLLAQEKESNYSINSRVIVKSLLAEAIELGASDIHIEPRNPTHCCFKLRVDGMKINSGIADVSNVHFQAVAAEINKLFDIDVGAYNAIQERQAETSKIDVLDGKQKSVNLRLQLNPLHVKFKEGTQEGKHIPNYVIRLISATSFRALNEIGLTKLQVENITQICKHNNAGIFIAGPTGSGKTTLAYAILATIHYQRPGISAMSVEDPVEVDLPKTQQMNITKTIGFDKALKAILRSDPDVVFCGEIRDKSTAHHVCAIKEVGNAIVTTIHADKAFDVIDRLKSISSKESFAVALDTIAKTVSVIIMPRLVRKVCQHCAIKISAKDDELFEQYDNYFADNSIDIKQGNRCEHCNNTGYKGRTQVAEVFVIDEVLQQMIISNASSEKIHAQALKKQSKDIYSNAVGLVESGITTLNEITRILPSRSNFG